MNLIDVNEKFKTEESCWNYLEQMRWPDGIRCVVCGHNEVSVIARTVTKDTDNKRGKLYQCLEPSCQQQFSATSGTIFHDSHLPLTKWFLAVALIADAKKGNQRKTATAAPWNWQLQNSMVSRSPYPQVDGRNGGLSIYRNG